MQENTLLQLKVTKVDAKAMLTDEGIVVLKGSQALTPTGDHLVAVEDILFTSA
ncbi:hypothetical protein [Vibrio sp. STUT-A16]|uniref:hypothetical protein n=1 Tax=Vibrio sp. STUT-A16 TaxID=2976237 RepID=UPI002232B86D|nr:hypothetical protein [Vibrio sp. STUT-A16]